MIHPKRETAASDIIVVIVDRDIEGPLPDLTVFVGAMEDIVAVQFPEDAKWPSC